MVFSKKTRDKDNGVVYIGYLRPREYRTPNFCLHSHIRHIAYLAPFFGLRPIVFSPEDIDFDKGTVKGLVHVYVESGPRIVCPKCGVTHDKAQENLETSEIVIKIPKIIDNIITNDQKYANLFKELEQISFLTRSFNYLNGKDNIYNMLNNEGRFRNILIPTKVVKVFKDVTDDINTHGNIILKQIYSNQGKSIIFLRKDKDKFILTKGTETKNLSSEQLNEYYNTNIANKGFISQPYIKSITKDGEPFDVRIACWRGTEGRFFTNIYPKIGNSEGVVTNIAQGGYFMPLVPLLKKTFPDKHAQVLSKLNKLASEFPEYYCDKILKCNAYDIALDLGIDPDGNLFMFEVNSGIEMGPNPIEPNIETCKYFRFLAQKYC